MEQENQSKWCLIGIPDQVGVLNVGGRLGTAGGPSSFRQAYRRLSGAEKENTRLTDLGDVPGLGADVEVNLEVVAQFIREKSLGFDLSLVVGGGHDHGFSHLKGIQNSLPKAQTLGCINLDAHLDLRKPEPKPTSGSPFYLAMERKVIKPENLVEFGIQEHCNASSLWDYAEKKNIQVVKLEDLRAASSIEAFRSALNQLAAKVDRIAISFDLDCVQQAHAPGVSAPQPDGFSPSEVMQMMSLAGAHPKVCSLGIFELCPTHDIDGMTARLAAVSAYRFVSAALKRR